MWCFDFMDLSSTVLRAHDPQLSTIIFESTLERANGIVLLYDITSSESFEKVTNEAYMYAWTCRKITRMEGEDLSLERQEFGCVLVGSKADIVKRDPGKRQVSQEMAEQWAQSQGFSHFEINTCARKEIQPAVEALARSMKKIRQREMWKAEERKQLDKKPKRNSFGQTVKKMLTTSSK